MGPGGQLALPVPLLAKRVQPPPLVEGGPDYCPSSPTLRIDRVELRIRKASRTFGRRLHFRTCAPSFMFVSQTRGFVRHIWRDHRPPTSAIDFCVRSRLKIRVLFPALPDTSRDDKDITMGCARVSIGPVSPGRRRGGRSPRRRRSRWSCEASASCPGARTGGGW